MRQAQARSDKILDWLVVEEALSSRALICRVCRPATFSRLICPRRLHVQCGGAGLLLRGLRRLFRAAPPPIHHQEHHGGSRRPLRQFCCLGCAPYLARACIYVNDGILLSVDTRPEADRLGVTDRVVEDHRSRVERWLCHAIEARVSISSRLLMMSNTSNRILLNFFAGQCEPQSHAGGGGAAVLCLQPFNNSTKTTQSCSQIDILICRAKLCLARRSRRAEKAAPQQPSWSKLRKKRGKGRGGPSLVAKPSKPARG